MLKELLIQCGNDLNVRKYYMEFKWNVLNVERITNITWELFECYDNLLVLGKTGLNSVIIMTPVRE